LRPHCMHVRRRLHPSLCPEHPAAGGLCSPVGAHRVVLGTLGTWDHYQLDGTRYKGVVLLCGGCASESAITTTDADKAIPFRYLDTGDKAAFPFALPTIRTKLERRLGFVPLLLLRPWLLHRRRLQEHHWGIAACCSRSFSCLCCSTSTLHGNHLGQHPWPFPSDSSRTSCLRGVVKCYGKWSQSRAPRGTVVCVQYHMNSAQSDLIRLIWSIRKEIR